MARNKRAKRYAPHTHPQSKVQTNLSWRRTQPASQEEEEETTQIEIPALPLQIKPSGSASIDHMTLCCAVEHGTEHDKEVICVICQDEVAICTEGNPIVLLNCCKTLFHEDCFKLCLSASKLECCVCKTIFGGLVGDSPGGIMRWGVQRTASLPGFPARSGIITIEYELFSGIQSSHHPNPGQPFHGTSRLAYLPNTEEGQKVLELLKMAFAARLTFTVGTSLTTGQSNAVIWNGIHHKTTTHGGSFGYPDDTYLDRVQLELRQKGIFLR